MHSFFYNMFHTGRHLSMLLVPRSYFGQEYKLPKVCNFFLRIPQQTDDGFQESQLTSSSKIWPSCLTLPNTKQVRLLTLDVIVLLLYVVIIFITTIIIIIIIIIKLFVVLIAFYCTIFKHARIKITVVYKYVYRILTCQLFFMPKGPWCTIAWKLSGYTLLFIITSSTSK